MKVKVRHHSQKRVYRDPFGAVVCGQNVVIRLQISSEVPVEQCFLRLWQTDSEQEVLIPMSIQGCVHLDDMDFNSEESSFLELDHTWFECEVKGPSLPGLVWYYFILKINGQTLYYGNNEERLGGAGQLSDTQPPSWQITVYNRMEIPEWYRRGIIYQIFVDRFFKGDSEFSIKDNHKGNALLHLDWADKPFYIKDELGRVSHWDFFGGNLEGIIQKLPYLHELGVSILYLNPIFEAVSNHKYDTGDYHKIDPMFGTEETFERLIAAAKEFGISIILDGVFSHTGSDSLYFNKNGNYPSIGAFQSPESPYYDWYTFEPGGKKYNCWWGVEDLPEVDEMNPSYRQFIYGENDSVIQKWMDKGVLGWRLDVADELPDLFIQEMRQAVKRLNREAVLIGEVWENASNKISYGQLRQYFWGRELDGTMNYPLREAFLRFLIGEGDSSTVHRQVMSLYETYPRKNFYALMNVIGSHDRIRVLTALGEAPSEDTLTNSERRNFKLSPERYQLAVQRLKLLSMIQMTFPGIPSIYYGDEAGLEGYEDPYNRGTFPWGRENLDLVYWFKRLIRWRKEYEVLQTGDFRSFCFEPDVYGLERAGEEEAIITLVNRSLSMPHEVELNLDTDNALIVIDLLTGKKLVDHKLATGEKLVVNLEPLSGRALFVKKNPPHSKLKRSAGVLLHISSLPSLWGIGDLGSSAYHFVDFLAETNQSLWQVLPLNPVGSGDSPYQSSSVFAGNPLLISVDRLLEEGLLQEEQVKEALLKASEKISDPDFEGLKRLKENLLRQAYSVFQTVIKKQRSKAVSNLAIASAFNSAVKLGSENSTYLTLSKYEEFIERHSEWLKDFALFQALKKKFNGVPWFEWDEEIALRDPEKLKECAESLISEIEFNQFVQYTFYFQWQELKAYASLNNIQIIGDMPLYVASDSCDVWVNRKFFKLDERGKPSKVAGVPPDYFSKTGQLWDNPVYNWEALAASDYVWWKKRLKHSLSIFDYVRVDHFRGLEAYWEIDAEEETAINGRWLKGPGKRFMESLISEFGELPLIAEDLGVITPEVDSLRQIFGLPGMKVVQFTPLHEVADLEPQFIYYSGTHDNNTLLGWRILQMQSDLVGETEEIKIRQECRCLIEEMYEGPAAWVIIPLQDILGLGDEARMNTPGTVGDNWSWQAPSELLTDDVKEWLKSLTLRAQRNL